MISEAVAALKAAGFPGVEAQDGVAHARLWSSSVEFSVRPEGASWVFAVAWPVRATEAQIDSWQRAHPEVVMDIHVGETRIRLLADDLSQATLLRWATLAEAALAACMEWRRAQRAPGEGM